MEEDIYTTVKDPHARRRVSDWCEQRLTTWGIPHARDVWDTVAGGTHVVTAGDTSARTTVVLVPGADRSVATHLPAVAALAARAHVVALDVPGEPGLSSPRRVEGARVHQLGVWLDQVVERLDRRVVLVGHALGGAAALASRSPLVVGRVLVSPGGLRRPRRPLGLAGAAVLWRARPCTSTSRRLLAHLGSPGHEPDPALVEWMTLVGRHARPGSVPGRQADHVTDHLRTHPPVVAAGTHDVLLPPTRLIPAVRDVLGTDVVPLTCGHLPDAPAWERVADLVAHVADRRA